MDICTYLDYQINSQNVSQILGANLLTENYWHSIFNVILLTPLKQLGLHFTFDYCHL